MKEQKHEGNEAGYASYGVEAIPFVEQYSSLRGTNIEVGVGQLLVCGENDNERERNGTSEWLAANHMGRSYSGANGIGHAVTRHHPAGALTQLRRHRP